MYYQLNDSESCEMLGLVKLTNKEDLIDVTPVIDIEESWEEFNKLEEHEEDHQDVNAFVEWHNTNRATQIERIFVEIIQP